MARIIVEEENGRPVMEVPVPDGDVTLTIGRHSECDVVLPGGGVSRHHARLHVLGGTPFVEDAGSTGGTRLNGESELTLTK